ncbi:MAG: reverse transcriptase domain-containing protein [Candidatus Pacebacteria bacterium]|nr:reverse transcriptase domain-containing protein [Candidatus Paceibacterota bacterium]
MKRKGNFYSQIHSFNNLHHSYLKVRKNKRYKREILEFSFNLEENLFKIQKDLKEETYIHGGYKKFIVRDSKKREIKAPQVKDRLVHHALCNFITPIFDNTFYHYSYACRKGKGNHRAVNDFKRKLKNKGDFFCFKADISKYFDSISNSLLFKIIKRKVKDKKALNLIDTIIKSNEKGIPIGNLTSQLFANIYLNEMDQFVKRGLKSKCFFRYMDDFVIFKKEKKELRRTKDKLEIFLNCKLDLKYKEKATSIFPVLNGIDFLGYVIFEKYTLPRKKTVLKMIKKIKKRTFKEAFNTWRAYARKTQSYFLKKSIFTKICFILFLIIYQKIKLV